MNDFVNASFLNSIKAYVTKLNFTKLNMIHHTLYFSFRFWDEYVDLVFRIKNISNWYYVYLYNFGIWHQLFPIFGFSIFWFGRDSTFTLSKNLVTS